MCNLNPEPNSGWEASLCLIPTQARNVVADPASLREKPKVMSQWLYRLTAARADILLVHGEHYDDLQPLAERAGQGLDDFTHDMMSIPVHDGTRVSDSALDAVVPWLRERSLL